MRVGELWSLRALVWKSLRMVKYQQSAHSLVDSSTFTSNPIIQMRNNQQTAQVWGAWVAETGEKL